MSAIPSPPEEIANPDVFKSIKRSLRRNLLQAFERVAFAIYYPDCDVTLQVRGGKFVRLDVREIDQMS